MDCVLFAVKPVTRVTIAGAPRFMARLLTTDVSKMTVGACAPTMMLNATGGMIDLLIVSRLSTDAYELLLTGEQADAHEAWIRQVSLAFDAEVVTEKCAMLPFVGDLQLPGLTLLPGMRRELAPVTFLTAGWHSMAIGTEEQMTMLASSLAARGVQKGEESGMDALRILACEPLAGLEFDENVSPLEAGLEALLDFDDPERIFIGRALTQARAAAGNYERLRLVAFDQAFDPQLLIAIPKITCGEAEYEVSSLARIPEMPVTVGLVRLPLSAAVGEHLEAEVLTDPRSYCNGALVIDPQL